MRKKRFLGSCLLAAALCLATPGCIGKFHLTSSIHDWNETATDSKWGNEAIFLGLVIIPVYGLSLLADAIIFNSIEFWSGDNPVDGEPREPDGEE